jgi:sec-independent protein translocase protein TatC
METTDTKSLPHEKSMEDELIAGGKVMPVTDHLSELRGRIIKSLWAVVILAGASFYFADEIILFLKQPLVNSVPKAYNSLHFTGPMDVFVTDLKVSALIGILLACPVWIYQFWRFFEPALYPRERRYIFPFIIASVFFFVLGLVFCFELALPMALEYLIGVGLEVGTPIITITDYTNLVIMMLFGFGIVFETPVILVLLAVLNILSLEMLTSSRRVVIVAITIIAAIITPSPDPLSQIVLAVPMYAMYELAIVVIRQIHKRRSKSEST